MKKDASYSTADVCERIRKLAAEKGISNADLARKSGLSDRLVYLTMHGRANLRPASVGKFAQALSVPAAYLMTGEDTEVPPYALPAREAMTVREERAGLPETVAEAIRVLARQFEGREDEIREDLLKGIIERMKSADE